MSLSLFLLLVACIASAVPHADAQYYYWSFSGEDAPLEDLGYMSGATIAQLETACSANPNCLGFNSDGYLKNSTANVQPSTCTLYIKRTVPPPTTDPYLVPMPQNVELGSTVVGVRNIAFSSNQQSTDLNAAFARYQDIIFTHPISSRAQNFSVYLTSVKVFVVDYDVPLQLGVNESYVLNVPSDGTSATISAATVYGVYRALETLSQLIIYNYLAHSYQISVAPIAIDDFPRFQHRGILVDTSRHWEPVQTILDVIDSMTYAKFNVLHWHIVDSQSFPFESITYPNLWEGAYTALERYTQEDVAEVVEYGRERGVRVMLEFDMPGHAASWCVGYPEVCPSASCTQPLNPATNATFDLITSMLGEVTGGKPGGGLVPENLLHLGGDEVDTSCWNSTPAIVTWMNQNNFDADDAYMYFVNRAHQIALDLGRIPVNWEEVFDHFGTKLDPRSVIHIWLNQETLSRVVAAGYRAILSNSNVWYLDHLTVSWEQFYMNEPFFNITVPAQQDLILGGEVCMWGETVDTSDIMETIWPRAAAAAERLWSNINMNQTAEFLPRLEVFRCMLNQRGVAAAPTNNAEARDAPVGPGSCYIQ